MKWEELISLLKPLTQIMPEQKQNQPAQTAGPDIRLTQETNSTPAAAEEKASAAPVSDKEAPAEEKKIPVIRTLKGDISAYIKAKDLSLVDIVAEAQKRRRFEEEPIKSKNFLLLTGIVFLVVGLAISGWFVFLKEKPGAEKPSSQAPKPLIFSDKQEIATLTLESRPQTINAIQRLLKSPILLNTVLDIPVLIETKEIKEFVPAQKFFNLLGISPPVNLIQSLEGSFTLGVFYFKKNGPFLIFKIRSFDLAFSGMLNWESDLSQDLKEILLLQSLPALGAKFQDKTIKNHDVRILYDPSNNPILIYGFIGKQYLIVASDIDTLEEIFRRFSMALSAEFY